jgi:hypothetical protein
MEKYRKCNELINLIHNCYKDPNDANSSSEELNTSNSSSTPVVKHKHVNLAKKNEDNL